MGDPRGIDNPPSRGIAGNRIECEKPVSSQLAAHVDTAPAVGQQPCACSGGLFQLALQQCSLELSGCLSGSRRLRRPAGRASRVAGVVIKLAGSAPAPGADSGASRHWSSGASSPNPDRSEGAVAACAPVRSYSYKGRIGQLPFRSPNGVRGRLHTPLPLAGSASDDIIRGK